MSPELHPEPNRACAEPRSDLWCSSTSSRASFSLSCGPAAHLSALG